jgi:inner membrane protein
LDPLSQGAIGASLSQSLSSKKNLLTIGIIGFLAGMSPDLDVLIKSDQDPLLFLEFHRQFTHSLVFIPIGGLIFASVFYSLFKSRISLSFKQVWFYASVGYGTHGILDTCTSYGTQLFWPFTNDRFSWNNISIIDPLFTLPIIVLITLAVIKMVSASKSD